jgi:hypothetical protein
VGTGKNETIAGKVYNYKAVFKQEEISWVYLKEKLYLRCSTKEVIISLLKNHLS